MKRPKNAEWLGMQAKFFKNTDAAASTSQIWWQGVYQCLDLVEEEGCEHEAKLWRLCSGTSWG